MYLMVPRLAVHKTMHVKVVMLMTWVTCDSIKKILCCWAETVESHQETFPTVNYTEQFGLSVKLHLCYHIYKGTVYVKM